MFWIYWLYIVSFTVGNFLYALAWSGDLHRAAERSFFEMAAIVGFYIIREVICEE